MKTLKSLTTALLLLISGSIFAQTQDVSLPSMVYPVPGQKVHLQFTYEVVFILKNVDATAVPANAGMTFDLLFDGVSQQVYTMSTHPKINAGDSLEVTIPAQSFSTPNPSLEVCVVVQYPGDPNRDNDSVCNNLPFSIDDNIDLGPSFVDVAVPDVDSILKPGDDIFLLKIDVSNFGTVTLPRDYVIKVRTQMKNTYKGPFQGTTNTALDNNTPFVINCGGQQPKVPTTQGPFTICAEMYDNTDDKNNSNDEYCQVFYAYDWTSIDEIKVDEIESFKFNSELYLNNLQQGVNSIFIFDMNGRQVHYEELTSSDDRGVIRISHLENGVYIVRILKDGQPVHSNKFTID